PAIDLAVHEVNSEKLLPFGHKLRFFDAETFGQESESILQTAKLWRQNVSAFIGPQETCVHEARLAASFNLPMISHFCSHHDTSNKVDVRIYFILGESDNHLGLLDALHEEGLFQAKEEYF
ncbi:hypothetical protein TCAL_17353, partial [Tigriopus californicus]